MGYLKLTNVNPAYKGGNDVVINLDNINYMVAGGFGISVYATTTEYNSVAGENDNFGFIGAPDGSTSDQIIEMLKEINNAVAAAPGVSVIPVHTTLRVESFSFSGV
jgi:hypothetical protein